MRMRIHLFLLLACVLSATSNNAFGAEETHTYVVTPLIPKAVSSKLVNNLISLMSSELDFSPAAEAVVQLPSRPSSLGTRCLASISCLDNITAQGKGERLITGMVSLVEGNLELDLVLFDAHQNDILRRKRFILANDPAAIADGMTHVIRELLTGKNQTQLEDEAITADDFSFDEDDELDFSDTPTASTPKPKPKPAPRPVIEKAPAEFDPSAITFSTPAATEIRTEEINQAIQFAPATAVVETEETYSPAPARRPVLDEPIDTLDDKRSVRSPAAATRATSKLKRQHVGPKPRVQMTARGGVSAYYALKFFTYGGEFAIPAGRHVALLAGIEAYSALRNIPEDQQELVQLKNGQTMKKTREWNTIFPFNVGVVARLSKKKVRPYVGADGIWAQYFVDAANNSAWAYGARARLGTDFIISERMGFNLNLAVGVWQGSYWIYIEDGIENLGALPQFSAGTYVAF